MLAAAVVAAYAVTLLLVSTPLGCRSRRRWCRRWSWRPGSPSSPAWRRRAGDGCRRSPSARRWGSAATSLVLLGFWAAGGRGVWLIPAAAGLAALLAVPAPRLRDRWRFQAIDASDDRVLLLALLIVPLVVARPFALVGVEIPEGHVYRAYFTADYVWRRAVVAELAKGDFLPGNPFYVGDVLHYYWLPHLLSAVEYRAWGPAVSLDTLLLTRSVLVDAAFVAALYGVGAVVVPVPWAALVGVLCGFLATSYEGAVGLWAHWRIGAPMALVRYLNIDAVARWLYGGMPIDGLQRVLWYQPHHAVGYDAGPARRAGRGPPDAAIATRRSLPWPACCWRRARSISSFAGVMFTAVAAAYEAGAHAAAARVDGGRLQRGRTRRCRWSWAPPSSRRCSTSTTRAIPTCR